MKKTGVQNIALLKGMQKANLIKFDNQTGTKITGLYDRRKFTCYYIDEAVGSSVFEYKGGIYEVAYISGCFNPYVFHLTEVNACYKDGQFAFTCWDESVPNLREKGYTIIRK